MGGIDGQARKPIGMLRELPVHIAKINYALNVHVMKNARFSFVLGMEWLLAVGADIDSEERVAHFQHNSTTHSLKTWATEAEEAIATQQVYLHAHTRSSIGNTNPKTIAILCHN
jgi:hypothetical protein